MILDNLPAAVGIPALYSLATLPALAVIWLTAIFGLNDVRSHSPAHLLSRAGVIEFGLGAAFFAMFIGSWMMITGVLMGASLYTWRGCLLMWGIAGVFAFVGTFAPWRLWIMNLSARARLPAPGNL